MQIIFRAHNILEAQIVAGLLQTENIQAFVNGQYLQGAIGDLPATDFATISVHDEQCESAKRIIKEYEQNKFDHTEK
jgi:hypothetical protein